MPNFDIHQMMVAACERDRERLVTSGWLDDALNVINRTVAWVRKSCEQDGHPRWLVDAVAERARSALLAGDFPLVPPTSSPDATKG